MIRTNFAANDPDKIDFTMQITMSAGEWRTVRDKMDEARKMAIGSYEVSVLSKAITDLLSQAERVFYKTIEPKDEEPI
jgi:hypothetical protein